MLCLTSSSCIMKYTASTRLPSSITRSMAVSSGEEPRREAASASVFPVRCFRSGFLKPTSSTLAGEPAAKSRFSHLSEGVRISVMTRRRISGSRNRLIQWFSPPSWTQGGMAPFKPVEPAVYRYMSAVMRRPAARAASMRSTTWARLCQFALPAALR